MNIVYKPNCYYTDYSKSYLEEGTFYDNSCIPGLVVFKPTLHCMAHCSHCDPRSKHFSTNYELSLMEYDEIINDLKKMGTEQICISGGEPLMYSGLEQLVRLITSKGIKVSLNTNGWLLNEDMFIKLIDAGISCVNLSIDSPFAEIHDNLRKLPGLYEKAISQIKKCKGTGLPFILNIRMVLSKYNYKHIVEMIELVRDIDADILSIDMIEADSKTRNFLLSTSEIREFKEIYAPQIISRLCNLDLKEELKQYAIKQINDIFNLDFNTAYNYEAGFYWPDDRIKEKCDIPSTFMIIEGDGMVLPCNAVEYNRSEIVGNVRESSVDQLWTSSQWKEFRKNKMSFCRECPMNMSFMLIVKEDAVVRQVNNHSFSSEEIKQMIKIDPEKGYDQERVDEYCAFFGKNNAFVEEINAQYSIDSLEYKVDFLYPTFFGEMDSNEKIFSSYRDASPYYSLRQLLGRPMKFEPQLEVFDFMRKYLKTGSTVIDYGCCVGDFSILFAKMNYRVIAFDLDIPTFDFAIERFNNRHLDILPVRVSHTQKIPLIKQKAHFVFCRDVLEHTVNPLDVLAYFYQILHDNGFLYISTMNPDEDIYVGAEHLEQTVILTKTREYKKFFEEHFMPLGIHGLYKKKKK